MSGGGLLFIPSSSAPRHFWFFSEGDGPILASALYGVLLIAVVFVMPGGIAYFVRLMLKVYSSPQHSVADRTSSS